MQRRRLAAELQRLRGASGKTLEEVADYLECSPAKISRIEHNLVAVRIQDARELLDLYEVAGERREALLNMVREARRKGWWSSFAGFVDESTENLLSLEEDAAKICVYDNSVVTPLLQTPGYTRAFLRSWIDLEADVIERRIELFQRRQQLVTDADGPQLNIVLDEAALRRHVGDPATMKQQLDRLIGESDRERMELRIMPFAEGPYQAMAFPFQIFEFIGDPRVVYTELFTGGRMTETAEEVGPYMSAFDQVWARAWEPAQTRDFLKTMVGAG